jgi:CDP-diglyceride synthetase
MPPVLRILWESGPAVVSWGIGLRLIVAVLPFAAALFLEALQHAYGVARFRGYHPGTVISLTVLGPASLLLARRAWGDGLVSRSYVVSLAAIVLLAFGVWAMRFEVNVTNKMVVADRTGSALAHLVGLLAEWGSPPWRLLH